MSDYTKATNFTLKDGLTTGDPQKIIKGSEIDAEYSAISNAITSKADLNSPTFTGTPEAPPVAAGTSNSQIATTAFVTTGITTATENLGTMSTQDADSVAITGGTLTGTTVNSVTVGTNGSGTRTVSTLAPSGGSNGDIWYRYS